MEAGRRSINDIFNGNRKLEIPFFQRSYVWREEQWERFLEDMELISETRSPYFMGSIILKQQPTQSQQEVGDIRTLVDGQQRLTTLNIFLKILCLKINNNERFDRVFKLDDDNQIALLHNHNDIDAFNEIINLDAENDLPKEDGITSAYRYFRDNIDTEVLELNSILSNVMFVGIDLGENEDEQQIFDTINSLGVRLTTAELIKNYFFEREDLESFEKNWKVIFEKDEEIKGYWDKEITAGRMKRNNIDLFFYSYLQIKLQDPDLKVKAEDKKNFGKVEGLFNSYKRFITEYNLSKIDLIEEIRSYAELYMENIDPEVTDRELTREFGIERINTIIFGLENTTLLPYVLYILHDVGDESERNKIFEYLESYLMKRMICRVTGKNYNRLFSEQLISNQCLNKKLLQEYIEKKSDKTNYMPDADELRNGFHESKLINKQTAGILYMIESRIRNRSSQATALLGLKRYSLEHLMPKKWENHWNGISSEEDRSLRNRKLLTLGNLTIITSSLNSSIRDADWQIKKKGKDNKKGLLDYSAGIETISDFLQLETWNESVIDERADFLYKKALEIWI